MTIYPIQCDKWTTVETAYSFLFRLAVEAVVLGLAVKICLVTSLICRAGLVWLTETSSVRALESVPRPSAARGILGNIET